jgi:exosortase/archaeosortase family protein
LTAVMQDSIRVKRIAFFCGIACLYYIVFWLVPQIPDAVLHVLQDGTGALVVDSAHLLGLSASYNPADHYYEVAGFQMRLLSDCVPVHYHLILSAAILLMPGQPWKRKGVALLFCNAALTFFNILRLVLLGMIGYAYPQVFDFAHDYFAQFFFTILTIFLCFAWLDSPKKHSPRIGFVIYSLAFSALFAVSLNAIKSQYQYFMAWTADKLLVLSNTDYTWSNKWWILSNNQFSNVRLDGPKFEFVLPQLFSVNLWNDMMGLCLFWGMALGSFYWFKRKGHNPSDKTFVTSFLTGTLLLMFLHLSVIVTLGWTLRIDPTMHLAWSFLSFVTGASILLPLACWWFLWHKQQTHFQLSI